MICACCQDEFTPRRSWQKFCSKGCRNAYHYERNRPQRLAYALKKRAECAERRVKCIQPRLTHSTIILRQQEQLDKLIDLASLQQKQIEKLAALQQQQLDQLPSERPRQLPMFTPLADDEPDLKITRAQTDGAATMNFINSMMALAGEPIRPNGGGNAKALASAEITFTPPNFDD